MEDVEPDGEFRCQLCGRRCKSAGALKKHFRELHERELNKKKAHRWVCRPCPLTAWSWLRSGLKRRPQLCLLPVHEADMGYFSDGGRQAGGKCDE